MGIEIGIDTACLSAFDKFHSRHDFARERDLFEADLSCNLADLLLLRRVRIRVHQHDCQAGDYTFSFDCCQVCSDLSEVELIFDYIPFVVRSGNDV